MTLGLCMFVVFLNTLYVGVDDTQCVCVSMYVRVCETEKVTHPMSVTPLLKCPFLFYFTPLPFSILAPH